MFACSVTPPYTAVYDTGRITTDDASRVHLCPGNVLASCHVTAVIGKISRYHLDEAVNSVDRPATSRMVNLTSALESNYYCVGPLQQETQPPAGAILVTSRHESC